MTSNDPPTEVTPEEIVSRSTVPAGTEPLEEGRTVIVDGVAYPVGIYASDPVAARPQVQPVAGPVVQRPTLVQFLLGSVLVLTDEVGERIIVDGEQLPVTTRTPESVFRPVSEFETLLGGEQYRRTRYLTIGMAGDARKAAERGLEFVDDVTDTAGRLVWRVAGPVWASGLLTPIRNPVRRWRKRGEEQVQQWITAGMIQENHSRAVASASINNFVQESVTDITNNPEVQVMVQEVIQSQSVGIVAQILQEVRERLISLDIWVQGVFGSAMPATPAFRDSYLRLLHQRRPQFERFNLQETMAGYPAGFVTRLVAFMIDVAILLFVYAIGSAAISGTLNLFGLSGIVARFVASGTLTAQITVALIGAASLILVAGYGILSWSFTGETIGNTIVGIQVVDVAGGRVSFWRAVRRMIGVYIAAIPLFLGFIWVLFSKDRRGWHDSIGGTYTVHDWPAQPEEVFLRQQVNDEVAEDRLNNN